MRIARSYPVLSMLVVGGLVLFVFGPVLSAIETAHSSEPGAEAARRGGPLVLTRLEHWDAVRSRGRTILFVDGDWNVASVAFRKPYARLARWSKANTDWRTVSIKLDPASRGPLWMALQGFWKKHGIETGGYKTLGGACRIVWLQDGQVVDHDWCAGLLEFDKLKIRSTAAFSRDGRSPLGR